LLETDYDSRRQKASRVLCDFSYLQYKNADLEQANAALFTYAGLLEELQKTHAQKAQKVNFAVA
jgi:hypothetical protein